MIENPIRVITIYPNFSNKGGAQNIALLLAEKLNEYPYSTSRNSFEFHCERL